MATPDGSLTITVQNRRRVVWAAGEVTVLLCTLRLVGRILPGCSAHFLLSLFVRNQNWGVLLLACRVGGLDPATSSRLLGRAVGLVDTQAVAAWRLSCRTFEGPGGPNEGREADELDLHSRDRGRPLPDPLAQGPRGKSHHQGEK